MIATLPEPTVVFGLDPGPETCGVSSFDGDKATGEKVPTADIRDWIFDLPTGSALAMEAFVPMGQRVDHHSIATCEAIGVTKLFCRQQGITPLLINRREVKQHFLGRATGSDAEIRSVMIARFGPPGTKQEPGILYGITSHSMAALAVAITAYDQLDGDMGNSKKFCGAVAALRAQ